MGRDSPSLHTSRRFSCSIISHRIKLNVIMKESISPQERILLTVIIFSGFCANSRYHHNPEYDIPDVVRLLDMLLYAIEESIEV